MMLDNTLLAALSGCGFPPRQQQVLGCLLAAGRSTAGQIAKRTGLKRPTVYAILAELVDHGIVGRSKQGKIMRFNAAPREMLPKLIEARAEQHYRGVKAAVGELELKLRELEEQRGRDIGGFEVSAVESGQAVLLQLQDALLAGDYSAIFNPQEVLVGETKKLVADFLARSAVTKPHIREIVVAGPLADWYRKNIRNKNHLLREFEPGTPILTDMILINGAVILSHYGKGRETAIKMVQPELYRSMQTVFDLLWHRAAR